jgi:hypothetical protein
MASYKSEGKYVLSLNRVTGEYERFAEIYPTQGLPADSIRLECHADKLVDFLNAFEAMSGKDAYIAILKGRDMTAAERKSLGFVE